MTAPLHVNAFLINKAESIAHVAKFDPFGEVAGSWCGQTGFDVQSNVAWGNPVCTKCVEAATTPQPTGPVCSNCEATTFVCGACGARREEY